jgi:hypothetical protein
MAMTRDPLCHLRPRTCVSVLVTQHAPESCTIVIASHELVAQIREKGIEFARSWALLTLFGKLIRTHQAPHGLAAQLHASRDLMDADPLRMELAHPPISFVTTPTPLHLQALVPSTRWRRRFNGECGNDRVASQQCRWV